MINDLINYFNGKKIVILGFGKEGQSSYKLIRKYLKDQTLYIADQRQNLGDTYTFLNEDKNIVYITGDNYLENLENYDIILKTPGVSFAFMDTSKFQNKIKSQLELLLEFFNCYTIGITGTKGKSTTSSLIYKMLNDQGKKCKFLGNIGIPVFDFIDEVEDDMTLVLEMSSHQLEFMKLSPNIAILLNIYEEHLDHYESYEGYALAKCNIYKYQNSEDYFLYNSENDMLKRLVKEPKATTYKVSINAEAGANLYVKGDMVYLDEKPLYNVNEKRNLVGEYNLNNIMFVLGVSEILKLDINKTIKSISEFKTLPHRLELVGKIDGVYYYDNSIGTVPMATEEAVKALGNVDTLIIGGMDRGLDYTEFIEFLNNSNIESIICMPKTGHEIAKKLIGSKAIIVETLEEAVEVAKKVTKKEMSCLLSPAAASYGFFKNFEEKGDLFQKLVKE